MTDKNYTHLVLCVDRSGSMNKIREDAQGGINSLIEDQKKLPGKCTFALYQFDNYYDNPISPRDIKEVTDYKLEPRGGTALLDSAHRAIIDTGDYLRKMPEDKRPSRVMFVIITDGEENASREITRDKLKELITQQTDKYNWEFVYVGANVDAFAEAGSFGIASAVSYHSTAKSANTVYTRMSDGLSQARLAGASLSSTMDYYVESDGTVVEGTNTVTQTNDNTSSSNP